MFESSNLPPHNLCIWPKWCCWWGLWGWDGSLRRPDPCCELPLPFLHHPRHHHHDQLDQGWPHEAVEGPGVQVKWGGQGAKLGRSSTKNCRPAAALAATAGHRTRLVDYLALSFQRHFQFDPFLSWSSFFQKKKARLLVCVSSGQQL